MNIPIGINKKFYREQSLFVRVTAQLELIGQLGHDNDYLYRFYRDGKSYLWLTAGEGIVGKKLILTLYQMNEFTTHNRISELIIDKEEQNRYKCDVLLYETV
jgi:hypothetical protein